MKLTFSTDYFAVFDDVLDERTLRLVWNYIQEETFEFYQARIWKKVNRLLDGSTLVGPIIYSSDVKGAPEKSIYPTGRGSDLVVKFLEECTDQLTPWIGKKGDDWQHFTCRPYLYPQNAGLSWHDDYTKTTGQYVLYVHPYWNAHWGSELLVTDLKDMPRPRVELHGRDEPVFVGPFLDNEDESRRLMETGIGYYIAPKPNRMVLMSAGYQHMVKKVEPTAGDNVRASITGFFINPDKTETRFQ